LLGFPLKIHLYIEMPSGHHAYGDDTDQFLDNPDDVGEYNDPFDNYNWTYPRRGRLISPQIGTPNKAFRSNDFRQNSRWEGYERQGLIDQPFRHPDVLDHMVHSTVTGRMRPLGYTVPLREVRQAAGVARTAQTQPEVMATRKFCKQKGNQGCEMEDKDKSDEAEVVQKAEGALNGHAAAPNLSPWQASIQSLVLYLAKQHNTMSERITPLENTTLERRFDLLLELFDLLRKQLELLEEQFDSLGKTVNGQELWFDLVFEKLARQSVITTQTKAKGMEPSTAKNERWNKDDGQNNGHPITRQSFLSNLNDAHCPPAGLSKASPIHARAIGKSEVKAGLPTYLRLARRNGVEFPGHSTQAVPPHQNEDDPTESCESVDYPETDYTDAYMPKASKKGKGKGKGSYRVPRARTE
jgi:hypothetical protein